MTVRGSWLTNVPLCFLFFLPFFSDFWSLFFALFYSSSVCVLWSLILSLFPSLCPLCVYSPVLLRVPLFRGDATGDEAGARALAGQCFSLFLSRLLLQSSPVSFLCSPLGSFSSFFFGLCFWPPLSRSLSV
ncbi:hypothetical protein NC653_038461 [Populus alba x Populus x berolinensis]|uniref:Transmembrane protein n=1 Tax=Populus alba x Populus x berolinensis TaxID=444605 RepID=A0AAD6PUV2_9ROSI|nr:hypothetical protein NC653_038461 [Populus alba x Populus x berolinensis]